MDADIETRRAQALTSILERIAAASDALAQPCPVALLAVSKLQQADSVRTLAALGQRAFGENYVQEAAAKRLALSDLPIEWHLIGNLQSNKCRQAADAFDWVHSVDRSSLVSGLSAARDVGRPPLNVLIQVNIDDEASKSGCSPDQVASLATAIVAQPKLALRGLMAIPAPAPDMAERQRAFERMHELYVELSATHASVDTLSMGMSEDFELAIRCGATMVRVGSALFGPRSPNQRTSRYPAIP